MPSTFTPRVYSDIDLNFISHPLSGDIPIKINVDAIRQALLNLFYLEKYDVPFDMDAYSNVKRYLFEPLSSITASNMQARMEWVIKKFEPRVQLIQLDVFTNPEEDGYVINIKYKIKSLNKEDSVTYSFQRVR